MSEAMTTVEPIETTQPPEPKVGRGEMQISELTPIAMATNVVIMTILAVFLKDQSGALALWLSVLYFCAIALVFYAGRALRRRRGENAPRLTHARAARRAVIDAVIAALPWVGLEIGVYPGLGAAEQLVFGSVTTGLIACGAFALAPFPLAARVFSFLLVGASIVVLWSTPTPAHGALVLCLVTMALFLNEGIVLHSNLFRAQALDRAALSRERLKIKTLINDYEDRATDWRFETDAGGVLTQVSRRLAEVLGAEPDALVGQPFSRLLLSGSSGAGSVIAGIGAGRDINNAVVMVDLDGEARFWSVSAKAEAGGRRVVGAIADVTEQRQAEAKIARLARYDSVTGLPNRTLFRDDLARAFEDYRADSFAVLLVQLPQFKAFSAHIGRDAGDEFLKAAAARLTAIAGDATRVARLGTDEFALIQLSGPQPASAAALASRVVAEFSRPFEIGATSASIGAVVGVALAVQDGKDPETILRSADLALLKAKAQGPDGWRFFETGMDAVASARRSLETDLRRAVEQGELTINYQPISDARSGEITGCEALIRWTNREHGPISPAVFIPIAEEIGLIDEIGNAVLRGATFEAARWGRPVRVAVNLSPIQFRNQRLLANVVGALADSGLPAHRLELEVTESVLLDADERTANLLGALRELGVKIALDDFGTGYSSLSYLAKFPFDKIKIDRSFVKDVAEKRESAAIVRTITDLARALGMRTTAEGVETQAQLAHLRANGCTEIQGYLLGRPMSAALIAAKFAPNAAKSA